MIKKILSKLPFIGNYFLEEYDWHNPEAILSVLSQRELNKTKRQIKKTIEKEQVADPKTLFYLHKYINSRFNEKSFNINGKYLEKQNKLEQLYSNGLAEINSLYSEYNETMAKIAEAEERYKKAIIALDSNTNIEINGKSFYDDTKIIKKHIDSLPNKMEW